MGYNGFISIHLLILPQFLPKRRQPCISLLAVPLTLRQLIDYGAEPFIDALRELGADTAVLGIGSYLLSQEEQVKTFSALAKFVPMFRQAGFSVAVWLWTFADECMQTTVTLDRPYTHIHYINCTGEMHQNRITLHAIFPYASLGFAVYD